MRNAHSQTRHQLCSGAATQAERPTGGALLYELEPRAGGGAGAGAGRVRGADVLAGRLAHAHAARAPVVLHQHVAEGDAAQQRAGRAVVEHAQAVRARLARVHEQVVQRAGPQVRVLRARPLSNRPGQYAPALPWLLTPAAAPCAGACSARAPTVYILS